MLKNLVSPIVSIAMLGMIESLMCGASASRMKDEAFDAADYLDSWQAGSQKTRLHGTNGTIKVQIDDPVDTAVPGTYCVEYTAETEQYHARTRLIVVVEE